MPTTQALFDQMTDETRQLLTEGMHELLKVKERALADANSAGFPPGRPFQARDFGIPQIKALIGDLNGPEDSDEPEVASTSRVRG